MFLLLVLIGVLSGMTTVLFGFGGGFVTVPVVIWVEVAAGPDAGRIAVATSAVVMVVNAAIATASTRRDVLEQLRGRGPLFALLAAGGTVGALLALHVPAGIASWGFVLYLAVTIVDVLVRPGFLRPLRPTPASGRTIRDGWGAPIGAVAAFLGVGGSVMTVPLLRRSGLPMRIATALANPLTLAVSAPATVAFLTADGTAASGGLLMTGAVDIGAALLLLLGAVSIIVLLRRRPPRIPDHAHAWAYLTLLVAAAAAMVPRII
ncbi:MAG: sulfite exporter TauE/SafE family protein [Microbacterium sp.]